MSDDLDDLEPNEGIWIGRVECHECGEETYCGVPEFGERREHNCEACGAAFALELVKDGRPS